MIRLPHDATTENEVIQYFKTRQLQFASAGFSWDNKLYRNKDGFFANLKEESTGKIYDVFYVMLQDRNKRYATRLVDGLNEILTVNDCKVIPFLKHLGKAHRVLKGPFDLPEYSMVESFYANRCARRSKVFLMNHIDEGMIILSHLNNSAAAMSGFCLHPMTQDDESLGKNFSILSKMENSYNVGLSLEYRNIANQYLSKREIKSLEEVNLSPLDEVNDMLIADKIQNYKDFLLHHVGTHPRGSDLEKYFNNWIDKLQCRDGFKWYMEYSKQFEFKVEVINVD